MRGLMRGDVAATRLIAAIFLVGAAAGSLSLGDESAGGGEAKTQAAAAGDAREADVRRLIDRYFHSWSSRDLERYGQCFMSQAAVQLIDPQGRLVTMPLGPFLKSQQLAQQQAKQPMTETPESVEIRFEAKLVRAVVKWKLVDGARGDEGYDHFTLMETPTGWRIANLIFYSEGPAKQSGGTP